EGLALVGDRRGGTPGGRTPRGSAVGGGAVLVAVERGPAGVGRRGRRDVDGGDALPGERPAAHRGCGGCRAVDAGGAARGRRRRGHCRLVPGAAGRSYVLEGLALVGDRGRGARVAVVDPAGAAVGAGVVFVAGHARDGVGRPGCGDVDGGDAL